MHALHTNAQYSMLTLGQWLKVVLFLKRDSYFQIHRNTISFRICKLVEQEVCGRGKWTEPSSSIAAASNVFMCVCLCRCVRYLVCVCVCAWKPFLRQQLRRCSRTRCYHSFWFRITAWRMGPRGPVSVAARLLPQLLSGSWFSLNRLFHKEKTPALSPLLCSSLQQTATLIE